MSTNKSAKENTGDKSDKEVQHILSLSYGKDSLACLGAIEKLGWNLDRIIHAEVWATDNIPADLPPMVEFKKKADKIIKDRWGIEVEHVYAKNRDGEKRTYEQWFYREYIHTTKIKKIEKTDICGFPSRWKLWCNSQLKRPAMLERKNQIRYLGIALDEPSRFHNLTGNKKSPLVAAGWTEADCWKWCEENDLLSPIYTTATRGGCWFCHNQGVDQLRKLRHNYPEYWELLLKWDLDSPVTFHSDGHTVHDFDKRFQMEDENLIPIDKKFKWKMVTQDIEIDAPLE